MQRRAGPPREFNVAGAERAVEDERLTEPVRALDLVRTGLAWLSRATRNALMMSPDSGVTVASGTNGGGGDGGGDGGGSGGE